MRGGGEGVARGGASREARRARKAAGGRERRARRAGGRGGRTRLGVERIVVVREHRADLGDVEFSRLVGVEDLEGLLQLVVAVADQHAPRHQRRELLELDLAVIVKVDRLDELFQLRVRGLHAHPAHHRRQLVGVDVAVAVAVCGARAGRERRAQRDVRRGAAWSPHGLGGRRRSAPNCAKACLISTSCGVESIPSHGFFTVAWRTISAGAGGRARG